MDQCDHEGKSPLCIQKDKHPGTNLTPAAHRRDLAPHPATDPIATVLIATAQPVLPHQQAQTAKNAAVNVIVDGRGNTKMKMKKCKTMKQRTPPPAAPRTVVVDAIKMTIGMTKITAKSTAPIVPAVSVSVSAIARVNPGRRESDPAHPTPALLSTIRTALSKQLYTLLHPVNVTNDTTTTTRHEGNGNVRDENTMRATIEAPRTPRRDRRRNTLIPMACHRNGTTATPSHHLSPSNPPRDRNPNRNTNRHRRNNPKHNSNNRRRRRPQKSTSTPTNSSAKHATRSGCKRNCSAGKPWKATKSRRRRRRWGNRSDGTARPRAGRRGGG